jgi:predicted dehydrogenase
MNERSTAGYNPWVRHRREMKKALNFAIVGCGSIAAYFAFVARLTSGVRLAACCDREAAVAKQFARRNNIPFVYTDYDELLGGQLHSEQPIDAVYLAVPHDLHLPFTRSAMQHGLGVLCEKPLAANLEQGRALARLSEECNIPLAVNYQYRYEPGCYALAQALRSGAMGRIFYARANIPWHRGAAYFHRGAGWHTSLARSGGGTLLTQGSHFLDLLLWAIDSPPVRASGITRRIAHPDVEVEDLAFGLVELANGVVIDMCSTMASPFEKPATLEVYAEKGIARWVDGIFPRLHFEGIRPPHAHPPAGGLHALQRSLIGFRNWLRGGPSHLCTAQEAFPALACVDAIYRSAHSGKCETVSPVDTDDRS